MSFLSSARSYPRPLGAFPYIAPHRRVFCWTIVLGLAAALPVAARALKVAKVAETISVNGQPARHTLASLRNCADNSLVQGPVATDDSGTAVFEQVEEGDYCLVAETAPGHGQTKVHVTFTSPAQRVDIAETYPRLSLVDRVTPIAFCTFTIFLVIYPILRFLFKPWKFRRKRLIGQLSGRSMALYYKQFRRGSWITDSAGQRRPVGDTALDVADFSTYNAAFKRDFDKWYGRKYYIAPFIGLSLLAIICGWWGCINLWDWTSGQHSIDSLRGLVGAAIAGAFLWIVSDEIDRLRRRDFTSSDLYYYIFRLVICVPFAWAITRMQAISQSVGIPLAFLLGAFPTSTLFTMARRIANQALKLGDDPATGKLELESLQSVGRDIAERFKDEGISTISQLAYSDPVDLTIRTNFDFNFVVDCVSQSLLWIYFGGTQNTAATGSPAQTVDVMKTIQLYAFRGAQEVASVLSDVSDPATLAAATAAAAAQVASAGAALAVAVAAQAAAPAGDPAAAAQLKKAQEDVAGAEQARLKAAKAIADSDSAKQTITDVAAKLGLNPLALLTTLKQVAEDPYTQFLRNIWL